MIGGTLSLLWKIGRSSGDVAVVSKKKQETKTLVADSEFLFLALFEFLLQEWLVGVFRPRISASAAVRKFVARWVLFRRQRFTQCMIKRVIN
eukprot:scaffold34915_cov180-Amphora_coffeaeformis.AAC.16